MFEFGINNKPVYKITKSVRLIETFSGIGTQNMALRDIGADYISYRSFENNIAAVNTYNAIHGTTYSPIDIKSAHGKDLGIVDKDKYEYILTYSFPCTDLSTSGLKKGMGKNSGTRSGLLWEIERLLKETKELPQILVMENVVQVHGNKNKADFDNWINFLSSIGYSNYYKDLGAYEFNVPQSRVRCIMVSILGNYTYNFPEAIPLTKKVNDFILPSVSDKFYLGKELVQHLIQNLKDRGELTDKYLKITDTYCIDITKPEKQYAIGAQRGRDIYDPSFRGRTENRSFQQRLELNQRSICNTITTVTKDYNLLEIQNGNLNIRKLTPLESWRFMGFSDDDFYKAENVTNQSNLYKQAGNAIVKQVLMAVFKKLF